MAFYGFIVLIMMFMAGGDVVPWLYFIILCSYVKLVITVVKFMKKVIKIVDDSLELLMLNVYFQTVLIFRKQSTEGYSVRKVISDLLGGVFGFLQMYINGYNYSICYWFYWTNAKIIYNLLFQVILQGCTVILPNWVWLYSPFSSTFYSWFNVPISMEN